MAQLALLLNDVVTQVYSLDTSRTVIGRSEDCDIRVIDVGVSGQHAAIIVAPNVLLDGIDDVLIEDLSSRNGTFVNGERVQRCQLSPDDVVKIGFHHFKLLDSHSVGRESTALIVMD